jgi:hypothetical protein
MCKVFVMTNMNKVDNLETAINTIAELITEQESDGFGYAISSPEGIFGERTNQTEGFKTSFSRIIPEVPFIKPLSYNRFGNWSEVANSGIFHGRTSTNHKTLINTHPIVKNGWTLIHNGVVSNHGPKYEMITSNDTEHLVHYISTLGVKGIEQYLSGYYAVAAYDPIGQLHVIKDNVANLFFARLPELDSFVFGTTKELIEDVCLELGWECSIVCEVKDNVHLTYNDNTLVSSSYIKPMGFGQAESKHASKSLGREIYGQGSKPSKKKMKFKNYDQGNSRDDLDNILYSEDEQMFLDEVNNCADLSYTFFDYHKEPMTYDEFMKLEDNEKFYCTVVRSDGTIVDCNDYDSERLWDGWQINRGAV